jgi:hypothetical protein
MKEHGQTQQPPPPAEAVDARLRRGREQDRGRPRRGLRRALVPEDEPGREARRVGEGEQGGEPLQPVLDAGRGIRKSTRKKAMSNLKMPKSFTSPGGRRFSIGGHEGSEGPWGREDGWIISYQRKPAGKLFRNQTYRDLPWHASTRQIFWRFASDAPTGIGFDVAAFATLQEVLEAWGRSADQILDWAEGKAVRSIYSKTGSFQRKQNPWARVFG